MANAILVIKTFLVVIIVIVSITSCKKTDNCSKVEVPTTSLENEYGCINTIYSLDISLANTYTIIRNQSDFENRVTGDYLPKIDFNEYDLIIGKKGLTSGNSNITYQLFKDCANNLELTVTFYQNIAAVAPNLTYHALIPKITIGQHVKVNIFIKY